MRSATALSLFLASTQAKLSSADISDESTVYVVYREEGTGGCISTGSPGILNDVVGIRGFVLDEEYSLVGGRSDEETGTCAEEMACFVAPQSEACLNLERTFEAFGEIIAQDVPPTTSTSLIIPGAQEDDTTTTNYYNCVRKTPSLSQCYQVTCGSSSMYPHCSFDVISTSALGNNLNTLVKSNANNNIVYAAHYSDEACSTESFAGLRGFLADGQAGTQVPVLGDGGSDCAQSVACLLQPDSFACEVLSPVGVAEVTLSTAEGENGQRIYQMCTLEDNEQQCQDVSAGECVQSPHFPSCYVSLI